MATFSMGAALGSGFGLITRKPLSVLFADDGIVPNNPRLPVLVYRGAVAFGSTFSPATTIDTLFETNGWGRKGRVLSVKAGDVIVLPAGTGRRYRNGSC